MGDLYNKANAPYLIAGALATLVLLASGTLAVAPYVAFLSPIAAFNVALPVALSLSILSILVLALSCKMISQNKKLDAQKAEPNEKNGLAKEQENIIQSLEPQIKKLKELNKRLSSQYNEIVKLIGSAAKKDEVEELISSFTAKLDEISKQANNATTKGEMEELISSFTARLDEISKQANNATTKGEMKELSKKLSDEMEKLIGSLITKEELEERLGSLIKKVEVKEELRMKFYEKDEERGKITFDDVILPNNIKQKLMMIYEPDALENGEGYILYGPPGTGKTMTAKAIASETRFKSAFISVSGSDLLNVSNINKVFEKAKKNTPCIVFIDEIDSIGKIRSDNNVESLNNLLAELDGFESRKGVTVIAATNHLGVLDRALIRGGRLSIHIKIPTLDTDTRKKIINEYFQKKELQNIFIDTILRNTNENFSPANLISLLKEIEDCGSKVLNNTKIAVICRSFKKTHNINENFSPANLISLLKGVE
ncbi:AAA family ATPase [Wolbachia endosymbiont (group A) of Trypoxylon clavicerum]|uniref:AAA family ATPase n=1 Tax=Wolbachia endosymbiont (group A) of Trypoxylon clavicerum TaxID=2954064 RepID=UPI0022328995|nr:AAA family ATPase [Wolbachia endosymbiont (group A) of Trypoxylon clavicerum]